LNNISGEKNMKFKLIIIFVLFAASCTSVQKVYQLSDYGKNSSNMIKRINILLKNETADDGKIRAFSLIASDMVKANLNYIIQDTAVAKKGQTRYCSGSEGTAVFTLMTSQIDAKQLIKIKGELYKCPENLLIWDAVAEADMVISSGDKKLDNMSLMYEDKLNKIDKKSGMYSSAMFSVLYDIIKTMPNPVLTDEEVNEKIELETKDSDSSFFDYFLYLPARTSS